MSQATSGRFFPITTYSLGPGASFANTYADLDAYGNGQYPRTGELGAVVEYQSKVYRLVKFDNGTGNVASTVGGAAHWKTRASFIVTSDQTDAEASLNSVAGAFLAIVTDLYYCWVQMGGLQAVVVDTTTAAGKAVIATTTDLTLVANTTNTKGDQLIYGISYGTNSTTSANIYWVFGNLL
jgi:hypothetical protein